MKNMSPLPTKQMEEIRAMGNTKKKWKKLKKECKKRVKELDETINFNEYNMAMKRLIEAETVLKNWES